MKHFILIIPVLAGCATAPALADSKAVQRRLGGAAPTISKEFKRYEKETDAQIAMCRELRIDDPVQHAKCLGDYAEGGPLWNAYEDLKTSYDAAATALESARDALEIIEAYRKEEKQ